MRLLSFRLYLHLYLYNVCQCADELSKYQLALDAANLNVAIHLERFIYSIEICIHFRFI